ncbi:MAG: pirin family protein [Burkholderiaceae bacterium]|nr:pirin family protein [Burkholderiaceae bacterium]
MSQPVSSPARRVERIITGQATSDGAGVKLTRVLTQDLQRRLDPFLMLDAFGSDQPGDYIAGFPSHPHRGFETITYMLQGRMRHRDSAGNEGLLGDGGVQWMTAGRGVIHSEMPEQTAGRMAGFQLWLNLAAKDKMCPPWYRDIPAAEIPEVTIPGGLLRVIAGTSHGQAGAMQRDTTEPLYLDLHLQAGASFEQSLPEAFNAFVYVYEGELSFDADSAPVPAQRMALLANTPGADRVAFSAGTAGARALLIAGRPLGESIAQYGPFVMNTLTELKQAVRDFQEGRLA